MVPPPSVLDFILHPSLLKLAYLFSRYPVPSQTFCDTEMRALEDAGFEVEIYSCSPPATSFRHAAGDRPRARVFYAPPPETLAWVEAAARRAGRWPGETIARHEAAYGPPYDPAKRARHALAFANRLLARGVEHLHVHFANRATHAALFLRELTGLPFSFTAHAQDFLVDLGSDALLGEMCARAAFVVAVSDWSRQALVERCPSAAGKIHRIYNGLPLDRWPELAGPIVPGRVGILPGAAWPEPPELGLKIFSVGRLIPFKGFADLVAACALLRARGVPFTCEIAGEGPLRDALQAQIRSAGLDGTVRLVGLLPQDEIRARLAACDVFALACRVDEKGACDVLPTVILEAMAAGKPVVSTRLAAVPEMVEDERTGLLAAPGDPGALADALARFAADPDLRAAYGRAGREVLAARFTAAGSARQLAALFAPGGVASGSLPASPRPAATVCLLDRWPDPALAHLPPGDSPSATDEFRWLAIAPGERPDPALVNTPAGAAVLAMAPRIGFLPDAVVLEQDWRDSPALAHRIEGWRTEAGGIGTDDFLLAGRRALYLHLRGLEDAPAPHLHAVGPAALLCAWLLRRLGAAESASFHLSSDEARALSGSALRRLAPAFAGGWLAGERKLAASLGENFHSAPPELGDWTRALGAWHKGA